MWCVKNGYPKAPATTKDRDFIAVPWSFEAARMAPLRRTVSGAELSLTGRRTMPASLHLAHLNRTRCALNVDPDPSAERLPVSKSVPIRQGSEGPELDVAPQARVIDAGLAGGDATGATEQRRTAADAQVDV